MIFATDFKKLIDDHGVSLTLVKKSSGNYDPATGSAEVTTTEYPTFGYFYNKAYQPLGQETVERFTRFCVISGLDLSVEPDIGDLLVGELETTTIDFVRKITSKSSVMVYMCGLKQ
jgi:hypothetical protein